MNPEQPTAHPQVVRNEFAAVEVSIDDTANARRLRILDRESGAVAYLDALELAALSRTAPDRRADLAVQVEPYRKPAEANHAAG